MLRNNYDTAACPILYMNLSSLSKNICKLCLYLYQWRSINAEIPIYKKLGILVFNVIFELPRSI